MPERAWNTFGRTPAPHTNRSHTRPKPPCPCCRQPGGFCDEHRARLAGIAAELVEDGKRRGPRKGRAIAGTRGIENDYEDDE